MRLAFLGTPEASVPSLRALIGAGHDVAVVVTRADRRRSRGSTLSPSPVKVVALELGLPVVHRLSDLDAYEVERAIVVAYGVIIPPERLARTPMLNVHFSLLPRWRGAAPVQRAILAGDVETGVDIISLEPSLDTGPIHAERRVSVGDKTADALVEELADVGAQLVVEVLASPTLLNHPRVQVGEATYAEKITKETLRLRPEMTVSMLLRTVRLGGAYCFVNRRRLGVVAASFVADDVAPAALVSVGGEVLIGASDGAVRLDEVRPEGSGSMSGSAWVRGLRTTSDALTWASSAGGDLG
jgi:methionyl-tRNA formyltransferase